MPGDSQEFKVDIAATLRDKLRSMIEKADTLPDMQKRDFRESLRTILFKLRPDPLNCGDPQYRLPYSGFLIYHCLVKALSIRYPVLETERVVVIQDLKQVHCFENEGNPPNGID